MKKLFKSIVFLLLFASFASCTNFEDDIEQDHIENVKANGDEDMDDGSKD